MQNNFDYKELLDISKKIGIPIKKIIDILTLLREKEIENNQLVKITGVSRNVLNQIKKELQSLFEPVSPVTKLSERGIGVVDKVIKKSIHEEEMWEFLKGKKYSEVKAILDSCKNIRHVPKRDLDQFTATVETTVNRGALLNFFADIRDKKILFLGDDDLTSVSVALFEDAQEICVVDKDDDILREIQTVSSEHNLAITSSHYDAQEQLPESYTEKFDIVFTDPPYTPNGVRLFLSRAIDALDKKNLAGRVYLCYGTSDRSKERLLPVQQIIHQSGMTIRWIFDKFNRYQGTESIGSSNLYICEVTSQTKPIIYKDYDEPIYTNY